MYWTHRDENDFSTMLESWLKQSWFNTNLLPLTKHKNVMVSGQDSAMADTNGQIVFVSKFEFGSSCMKNKVGGVYCMRTVQTVSEV